MIDCSSKLGLRVGDQLKSVAEAEQDRQKRPSSVQFSSRLTVSKRIYPSLALRPRKTRPFVARLGDPIEVEYGLVRTRRGREKSLADWDFNQIAVNPAPH